MPDADESEILQRLKNDPATAHIPVVIVTARPVDDELRRTVQAAIREKGGR